MLVFAANSPERHGAVFIESLVKPQPVADAHERHAECAAEVAENLADELIQFRSSSMIVTLCSSLNDN